MQTAIVLPPELRIKAEQAASARGLSLEEFVCTTLETVLAQNKSSDPLFSDRAVFKGNTPSDLSSNHDAYLYGE